MKVKANVNFERVKDMTVGRTRKNGEIFEVDKARAELLFKHNLISIVEEDIKQEPVIEEEKPRKVRKPRTKK